MPRLAFAAAVLAASALPMPASAVDKPREPSWDACYMLGWYRGVHVELGELPDWMDACLAGQIPFDAAKAPAAPVGKPRQARRTPRPTRS